MQYALFIEQIPFEGLPTRPSQRTFTISALNDEIATREANDYVDHLFDGVESLQKLKAHLQRDDGSVVREILRARDPRQ